MSKRSKQIQWKAEYFLFRSVEAVVRCIPLSWCYHIGAGIGDLAYRFAAKRRNSVVRNLQAAFGNEKSREEILKLSREVFRRNIANVAASIKTATMPREKIRKRFNIEGLDDLQPLIDSGKGIIAVLAHMGNWEILAQVGQFACPDNPSGALYRPLNNPYLDALVKKRRESQKNVTFSRRDKLIAPTKHLKERGILGILTDQRVGRHGILVPFFGRVTPYTPLPDLLKRRTDASLIGVAVITDAPGRWTVRYFLPVGHDETSNSADVAHITEQIMRESPADCFWLHDRWKLSGKPFDRHGKHGFQSPTFFTNEVKPLHFAIVVTDESQFGRTTEVVEHLLKQQEDLHCHIISTAPHFPEINSSVSGRITILQDAFPVEAMAKAGNQRSLFVVLTWDSPLEGLESEVPQVALASDHSFEKIAERLGATPISLTSEE